MKRQLDRLKGKRLVTGDPNLMTKDEICINATPNGVEVKEIGTDGKIKDLAGSDESGGNYEESYYAFTRATIYKNDTRLQQINEEEAMMLLSIFEEFGGVQYVYNSSIDYTGSKHFSCGIFDPTNTSRGIVIYKNYTHTYITYSARADGANPKNYIIKPFDLKDVLLQYKIMIKEQADNFAPEEIEYVFSLLDSIMSNMRKLSKEEFNQLVYDLTNIEL